MKKLYTKHFRYKGQMINYYYKVCANPNVNWCVMYSGVGGYTVEYTYE